MQERPHSILHQLNRMSLILVSATVLLAMVGTLIITLRIELTGINTNLTNSAQVIAQLPQVCQVAQGEGETDWLTAYLDSTIASVAGIDLVLVGDHQGVLQYTPDPADIGSVYPGNWEGILEGDSFVLDGDETHEAERCAFTPVRDTTGSVVGFVGVGITARSVRNLVGTTILQFLVIALVAGLFGMLLSRQVSRRIKSSLMGYEPDDFRLLFQRQEEVLESLEEGIAAIDRHGRVIYLNQAAANLFGLKDRDQALGRPIREFNRSTTLERLLKTGRAEHNVSIDDFPSGPVLSDRMPIRQDGRVVGAVAIFRDRTEVTRLAENLTGVRHMVEAMRAYTHEFMNKLHVIHGLLQMEKYDMAKDYIMDITKTQQEAVSRIMDRIEDPTAAALLIGKTSRAAELGIRLILHPKSTLSNAGRFLPSAACVTILGNLITNAIDSLNQSGCQPKEITVTVREDEKGLFLCVEDTGPGIDDKVMPHIFTPGFSTKGENRGTGLSLVKEITDTYGGQIRVESERNVGAIFFVTFHHSNREEGRP